MENNAYDAGVLALEQKNYAKAVENLEKAYADKKTFKLNYLLFSAFKGLNEHAEASLIAEDYLLDYIRDNEKLSEYVKEAILAGKVRKIQMTLDLMGGFMTSNEADSFSKLFEKTLAQARKDRSVADIKRQLAHLGALDTLGQRKLVSQADCLTIEEFKEAVVNDLNDPYVHPVVRASLLDELRYLGSKEKVRYRLFSGEEQEFIPANLKELDEYLMYQHLVMLLENDDTISEDLRPAMFAELRLKLQLLYPKLALYQDPAQLYRVLLQKDDMSEAETALANELEKSLKQWNV